LLLYLIRKQNFNILDIPLADVTRQYLKYVDQIRTHNLELASEYLLMAAMLIEIKSRMLLPAKKAAEGDETEDPRAELVRRLVEYEQMKLAAIKLDALPVSGLDFWPVQAHLERTLVAQCATPQAAELLDAWSHILRRSKLVSHHTISPEHLSVREHMSLVLRTLQGHKFLEFQALFDIRRGIAMMVVNFIAVLELAREGLLEVSQAEAFAPMYIRLAYQPT
jgi:segregation and condensation protein A